MQVCTKTRPGARAVHPRMSFLPENHCALCGIDLHGLRRRFQGLHDLRAFVRSKCRATPFAYTLLASVESKQRHPVCIPCINWKRRVCSQGGMKRCQIPCMQLDQLMLFMMQPGDSPEPDNRCMPRLFQALRDERNPYQQMIPLPVVWMLAHMKEDSYTHAVAAWWEYNRRTQFFRTAGEARRVRTAIKQGCVEEEREEV